MLFHKKCYTTHIACTILIIFTMCLRIQAGFSSERKDSIRVIIDFKTNSERSKILSYFKEADITIHSHSIEADTDWHHFFEMQHLGLNPAIQFEVARDSIINVNYLRLDNVYQILNDLRKEFPHIIKLDTIGFSTRELLPILGVKLTNNKSLKLNKPAMLFTGLHHAKEISSVEVCLYVLKHLCHNYESNQHVRKFVDNIKIWFVPVVNPDGYRYILDEKGTQFYWRKNLSDNNSNSIFDPEFDGVDLNRNYDMNWDKDTNTNSSSFFYKGPYPFSESETCAIKQLTFRENFVLHLDYHSYGEIILYPWKNYPDVYNSGLIQSMALQMSQRIKRLNSDETYSIRPMDAQSGQCSNWMLAKAHVISFTIECGTSHFPTMDELNSVVENCAQSAFYSLERILESAVQGFVYDAIHNHPLRADILINGSESNLVKNPQSNAYSGFFHILLQPGEYSLRIKADGYKPMVIENVIIKEDNLTNLDIKLIKNDLLEIGN